MTWKTDSWTGWGRALTATGEIARPERAAMLAELSRAAPAMGGRRSYGDAALNDGGRMLDMTRLDRLLGFDPETGLLEAEAGVRIGEVARLFAPRGWLPTVMPGTGFATLGGCVAMDVHGKNHHVVGSFCQHVERVTLLQDGAERDVTPEDGALWRATCGGLGQTGVIARVALRLLPCAGPAVRVREHRAEGWDDHFARIEGSDAPYVVGWIDATARGAALGRGIVEEGEIVAGPAPRDRPSRRVPVDAPGVALSPPVVRAFNAAYLRRVPRAGRSVTRSIPGFFFPLDAIHDWNRLYGKRGFHQFQCVVPPVAADTLREMLALVADSGLASPLAVLKRMGPGRAGHLSFPMEGWTLAVDFRNRAEARDLIARLEEMTAGAGGRLYLAKDSLAEAARLRGMYPELPDWAETVAGADPRGVYVTDMVRRLELRA